MFFMLRYPVCIRLLACVLLLLSISACSSAYRFRYDYIMVDPPGGNEGMEDEHVRISLTPVARKGILHLVVVNKTSRPIRIVWEQTHYLDPRGRRREASETGIGWFFRPQEWLQGGTPVAPGGEFRAQVQAGEHQTYNPLTVSRQASGEVTFSTSPRSLLPETGNTPAVGTSYQGQEFRFILALRIGPDITHYPFTFRITAVDVQRSTGS
jgi:hypothetical protein